MTETVKKKNPLSGITNLNFDQDSAEAYANGEEAVKAFNLPKRKWIRGKTGRKKLAPEWVASIKSCKIMHPDWAIAKISVMFDVSSTTVSQIVYSKDFKTDLDAPAVDAFLAQEITNKTMASKALGKYIKERYESGDIKAADASVFATIIEKTFNRERLINGLSTDNQAVQFKWQE